MVRIRYIAPAVLISLTLTAVAIAQSNAEPQATETGPDNLLEAGRPVDADSPHWVATADALFLQRSAANNRQLLYDPGAPAEVLSASNLNFSFGAGERLGLCWENPAGMGLELLYFGIDSWQSSANVPSSAFVFGVGDLSIDNTITVPVTAAQFQYTSRLYSGEINLRYALNDWLTPLAGLRWVDFEDRYAAGGTENHYLGPFSDLVRAHNQLYGGQFGLDARLLGRENVFQIDALAKAGLYCDAAAQNNDYVDTHDSFSASASNTHLAFLGEIGVTGSWQINRHFALRGGYQVMWLTGVALAPNQIAATDFAAGSSVDTSGSLFCQGANAGLEIRW
jgi:hypothetical protein